MLKLKLLFVLLAFCQSNSYGQPLPVEVASGAKTFAATAIDLSPDGLWIAYTLHDPHRRKLQGRRNDQWFVFNCTGAPYAFSDTDVSITNTQTGQTINLTGGRGANWGPRWSPDGKSLAFYSDRSGKAHVWLWQQSSGKLRPLSSAVVHVRFAFEKVLWSPDSKRVITKILGDDQRLDGCFEPGASQPPADATLKSVYVSSESGTALPSFITSFLGDLAVLELANGKFKRIVT